MPIFISQGRYTRDAVKGMMAHPEDRSKPVSKLLKDAGGKLLSYYLTFGEYGFLLVAEAPDEGSVAAAVLAAVSGGGVTDVRTTLAMTPADAMKAFGKAQTLASSFRSAGQGVSATALSSGEGGRGASKRPM